MMEATIQKIGRAVAGRLGRNSAVVSRLRPLYESVLGLVTGGRGVTWPINGVPFRIDPHYRAFISPTQDAEIAERARQLVKPGATCIDVGANVGLYILQMAHWAGPTGRVIGFEPNPGAREVIARHVRMNGFEDRVQVVPAAVSGAPGQATFEASGAHGMVRLGAPTDAVRAQGTQTYTVPVMTLDEYCRSNGVEPDLLVMDIEGFEVPALEGAVELFARRGNALHCFLELHPDAWSNAGASRERMEAVLGRINRRAVPLTGQRDALREYGHVYLEPLGAAAPARR